MLPCPCGSWTTTSSHITAIFRRWSQQTGSYSDSRFALHLDVQFFKQAVHGKFSIVFIKRMTFDDVNRLAKVDLYTGGEAPVHPSGTGIHS